MKISSIIDEFGLFYVLGTIKIVLGFFSVC